MGDGSVEGQTCNWCAERAQHSFEIFRKIKGGRRGAVVRTGMFIFTCADPRHKKLGEEHTQEAMPALRK